MIGEMMMNRLNIRFVVLLAQACLALAACSSASGTGGEHDGDGDVAVAQDISFHMDSEVADLSLDTQGKPELGVDVVIEQDGTEVSPGDLPLEGLELTTPEILMEVLALELTVEPSPEGLVDAPSEAESDLPLADVSDASQEQLAETLTALTPAAEWRVNAVTQGAQSRPDVAARSGLPGAGEGEAGFGFVVVWESDGEVEGEGRAPDQGVDIVGRCLDAEGQPLGPAFPISGAAPGDQRRPSVVGLSDGAFAIAWDDERAPGDADVYLRRYIDCAKPEGDAVRMNSFLPSWQGSPRVALASQGTVTVVWESGCTATPCEEQDGSWFGVFARRQGPTASVDALEWQVNSFTIGDQMNPDLVALPGGRLLVLWASLGQVGNGWDVFSQRVSASGALEGPETRVNGQTEALQSGARAALLPDGDLLVTWMSRQIDGSQGDVFLRRLSPGDGPLGSDLAAHPDPTGEQIAPAIATLADGSVLLVFSDDQADGDGYGLRARRFDSTPAPLEAAWTLNDGSASHQHHAAIAAAPDGGAVIVWQSGSADDDSWGIIARRLYGNP
jgi:hypothetical protein